MFRSAQHDRCDSSAVASWSTLIRRINSAAGFRALLVMFVVVTQLVLAAKDSAILWWSFAALVFLALGLFFPRGAQLYGNTFFATLLLFVGLSIELLRCKKRPEQVQPAAS
jgi:Na+/melibiose symporter-like transporter